MKRSDLLDQPELESAQPLKKRASPLTYFFYGLMAYGVAILILFILWITVWKLQLTDTLFTTFFVPVLIFLGIGFHIFGFLLGIKNTLKKVSTVNILGLLFNLMILAFWFLILFTNVVPNKLLPLLPQR